MKNYKILIVDDAPQNVRVLGELLKDEYTIMVANNGMKAIEIAKSENVPDLILLDVLMPGMNGYDVCRNLKTSEDTQGIPIIFITGKNTDEDEVEGLACGAVDYITKPFNAAIVKARVKTHLEIKRYRDLLEKYSYVDGLTGIWNKRKFSDYLETIWNLSIRDQTIMSLIMIDIDHFKAYNDTYGHQKGDDCLMGVATGLTNVIRRKTDLLARYGGEEFVCILPKTSKDEALKIGETLRCAVMELQIDHKSSSVGDSLTVSVGVSSTYPNEDKSAYAFIEKADSALYESKQKGRNRVTYLAYE